MGQCRTGCHGSDVWASAAESALLAGNSRAWAFTPLMPKELVPVAVPLALLPLADAWRGTATPPLLPLWPLVPKPPRAAATYGFMSWRFTTGGSSCCCDAPSASSRPVMPAVPSVWP